MMSAIAAFQWTRCLRLPMHGPLCCPTSSASASETIPACRGFAQLRRALIVATCLWGCAALPSDVAAGTYDSPIEAEDIDAAATRAWQNGAVADPNPQEFPIVLGFENVLLRSGWTAGSVKEGDKQVEFLYRLAFKHPVRIGTLFVAGTVQEILALKPGVAYPGVPTATDQWELLKVLPEQSGARLITLPVEYETRALLFREVRREGWSRIQAIRLFSNRLHNLAPAGFAYASAEYTPPMSPTTFAAANVTSGSGVWISTGKDDRGRIPTPAINDISPAWFMIGWSEEQSIDGLWINDNFRKIELEYFTGAPDVNPHAGLASEWKKLKTFTEAGLPHGRWLQFTPLATRGVRIRILKTDDREPQVATITGLHVFTDLGTDPAPKPSALLAGRSAPKQIALDLPQAGNLTLVVDGPQGQRARNLVTRAESGAGKFAAGWDLKDETGNYVAPGTYRWKAISYPTFELKYEMTVYPNVSRHAPGNSPWLNGHHGPGGWLADHTPPVGVCTAGDRVYLSAYVAESGVSFIECDLDGKKLWGHHSFAAWTGPRYLASDGKTVFVGSNVLNTTTDGIWGVDIESKEVRSVLQLTPTATRKRGLQGIAARDNQVALSVHAQDDWLANAAGADDVDTAACYPLHGAKRKPRVAYEVVPDPQGDFARLFRLEGTPPGGATSTSLTYLQTQRSSTARQHIVLAFKRPVPLGSVAFPVPVIKDVRVRLSVLKPKAPFPPNPENSADWQPFEIQGTAAWDVVPAPAGTVTRALRITFAKGDAGDDDPLASLITARKKPAADSLDLDALDKKPAERTIDLGGDTSRWFGQIEGLKLLQRRFARIPDAEIRVSSGTVSEGGEWDAERSQPLTEDYPAVYALEWKQPQSIRGLAIREIDGEVTKIDVYTGAAKSMVDITAEDGWQEVAEYRQARRNHHNNTDAFNATARYIDGYVDFGREVETRAVRLRVVQQFADNGSTGEYGMRQDLGGMTIDAARCRVYGVAALQYAGGEVQVDPIVTDRIELYDAAQGNLLKEVAVPHPGEIAWAPSGELFALSGSSVVQIDLEGGRHRTVVSDLESPRDLAFDKQGLLYVFDGGAERQQVRVYDSGKFVRSIGAPGGFRVGPWEPRRMGQVTAIDVDQQGQLWVVENQYWPKRVTLWTTGGEFIREFLGNTAYGGGGVLDPADKTRLFYGPLEFELDWKTGLSRLKNLTLLPGWGAGEVPMQVDGRTYLVTRPQFAQMQVGVVYLYEQDHLKLAAAVGSAAAFEPLKRAEFLPRLAGRPLTRLNFVWSDRNGNGEVDPEEVEFAARPKDAHGLTAFRRDLSIQSGAFRWKVKQMLPSGVPVYEEEHLPQLAGRDLYRLSDGSYYRLGNTAAPEAVLAADGTPRWTFAQEGEPIVQALHNAKPWRPDQVVAQFGVVGHERAPTGDLGEFVVIHGNGGGWNVWTTDGMLVGPIFRDLRSPQAQPWSMPEHQRGMLLKDVTCGQEHFSGYFCKTADDRFYAVAGHNHISVVEVLGLDRVRRLSGTLEVTAADLQKTQSWEQRRERDDVYARAPVLDCYQPKEPLVIDGNLADWAAPSAVLSEEQGRRAEFRMAYDDEALYLAWQVANMGPLKNTGAAWDRLFQTGASVDVQLAVAADAPEDRQAPVEGDLRLLLTVTDAGPRAVLYQPVAPGAPAGNARRIVSPTGEVTFDQVLLLKDVKLARKVEENRYVLEAAVPLKALGLQPQPGLRLKCDWGVLTTGPNGNEVLRRIYWANKATQVVADAPSESRLHPNLWGHVRFGGRQASSEDRLDAFEVLGDGKKKVGKAAKDLLDDL